MQLRQLFVEDGIRVRCSYAKNANLQWDHVGADTWNPTSQLKSVVYLTQSGARNDSQIKFAFRSTVPREADVTQTKGSGANDPSLGKRSTTADHTAITQSIWKEISVPNTISGMVVDLL